MTAFAIPGTTRTDPPETIRAVLRRIADGKRDALQRPAPGPIGQARWLADVRGFHRYAEAARGR